MRHVMVRYRVRPDQGPRNEGLVRAVYEELARTRPPGLRYATFKLDDGVSFVHLASTADGRNPLPEVEAFKRFQQGIAARCEEGPVAVELQAVGSFGRLGP